MAKASSHRPAGFSSLSVHLTVNAAAKYIEFLKQAFDAVELTRSASPDGRLLNASVRIGDSILMLNDVFPEFGGKRRVADSLDSLLARCRYCLGKEPLGGLLGRNANAGAVLGRSLRRGKRSVRVRVGHRHASGGFRPRRN